MTGGCGFVGSNLVRLAVERGYRVVNLDALTYAGNRANLASLTGHPAYLFVHGSINDRRLVRSLLEKHRPAAILNLAAESHVDRSIDEPTPFIETNINGAFVLAEAALDFHRRLSHDDRRMFRFLHVSTDEVYGSLDEGESDEQSPYRPNSPYAASKAAADHLVRAYGKTYGLPVLTTNCSNNYGPYQFPEKLVPLTILNALDGRRLPLYGDGTQVRDWLHVEDHCGGLLLALEAGKVGETYNLGAEARLTNLDLVRKLCRVLDEVAPAAGNAPHEELISFVPDRPGHDRRYALSSVKARGELGWTPRISLDEGLRNTVLWYVGHRPWCEEIRLKRYAGDRLGRARAASEETRPAGA